MSGRVVIADGPYPLRFAGTDPHTPGAMSCEYLREGHIARVCGDVLTVVRGDVVYECDAAGVATRPIDRCKRCDRESIGLDRGFCESCKRPISPSWLANRADDLQRIVDELARVADTDNRAIAAMMNGDAAVQCLRQYAEERARDLEVVA